MKHPDFHKYFVYKKGNLYWKVKKYKMNIGDKAGSNCPGRSHVMLDQKYYKVHRVIFWMHHGYFPIIVDHIDGNNSNNKIENLRAATHIQNSQNMKIRPNNKCGIKGVCWCPLYNKWTSQLVVDGSTKNLGYFKNIKDAERAVREARVKYHGEFARHA